MTREEQTILLLQEIDYRGTDEILEIMMLRSASAVATIEAYLRSATCWRETGSDLIHAIAALSISVEQVSMLFGIGHVEGERQDIIKGIANKMEAAS